MEAAIHDPLLSAVSKMADLGPHLQLPEILDAVVSQAARRETAVWLGLSHYVVMKRKS